MSKPGLFSLTVTSFTQTLGWRVEAAVERLRTSPAHADEEAVSTSLVQTPSGAGPEEWSLDEPERSVHR
jgi:hypothetical protein